MRKSLIESKPLLRWTTFADSSYAVIEFPIVVF